MNIRRIGTLTKNEVLHGSKGIILVMSVVMPILLALFFNLAFGNIFTDRAKLGIYDGGSSQLSVRLESADSLSLKTYQNEPDLKKATADGSIDMGIVLPDNFDATLSTGTVRLKAYVWGESLAKNRAIIPAVLADAVHEIAGANLPVNIETVALGDESSVPWSDRLLPLTVLMAIFYGGMMLPASSLIKEKQRRTLEALNVTPATVTDIFTAKGLIGAVLATIMGVLTLAISTSFGSAPALLVMVLGLGAVLAAEIGLLVGAYVRDMNTLFAFWKFGGILLFGPAIVYMFPQIPSWIGYIFPTFYVIKPVVDISVSGLGFGAASLYIAILIGIVIVMALVVMSIVRRLSTQALKLN
jgi:ABC-2 type transport system permease protein